MLKNEKMGINASSNPWRKTANSKYSAFLFL